MTDIAIQDPSDDGPLHDETPQDGPEPEEELELEAPEADTAEQHRVIVLDEDEYRSP
ncbi:hypothetical protein [Streptacidiphilus sp. EB129]|jgi:hypothetical protein|uniref:hypothetical protein n=1 Tax=Streptacidiphilus sp. EB129 TaxID=3156262 RepID=UPI0035176147